MFDSTLTVGLKAWRATCLAKFVLPFTLFSSFLLSETDRCRATQEVAALSSSGDIGGTGVISWGDSREEI